MYLWTVFLAVYSCSSLWSSDSNYTLRKWKEQQFRSRYTLVTFILTEIYCNRWLVCCLTPQRCGVNERNKQRVAANVQWPLRPPHSLTFTTQCESNVLLQDRDCERYQITRYSVIGWVSCRPGEQKSSRTSNTTETISEQVNNKLQLNNKLAFVLLENTLMKSCVR